MHINKLWLCQCKVKTEFACNKICGNNHSFLIMPGAAIAMGEFWLAIHQSPITAIDRESHL